MVAAGPTIDPANTDPDAAEPTTEVVVFAAPALKLLVVAVDALVVAAPNADIPANQAGPVAMANERMPAARRSTFRTRARSAGDTRLR